VKRLFHNFIISSLLWLIKKRGNYPFKLWIDLEGKKERILEAVEQGRPDFPDVLLDFCSTASWGLSPRWFEDADWLKVVELFFACLSKSPQIKIPLTAPNKEKYKDEPWAYEGRTWPLYAHLLAQAYGWTLSEISQLRVSEALSMIQEIMVDKQLEKEFQYGLSEIAYPYNKQTKQSSFKPLDRPYWMRPELNAQRDIPRFTIPQSYIPEGVVMMENVLPEEFLPKTLH
jgi:hypothetical protein